MGGLEVCSEMVFFRLVILSSIKQEELLIANDFVFEDLYPVDHDFVITCPGVAPPPAFLQCSS